MLAPRWTASPSPSDVEGVIRQNSTEFVRKPADGRQRPRMTLEYTLAAGAPSMPENFGEQGQRRGAGTDVRKVDLKLGPSTSVLGSCPQDHRTKRICAISALWRELPGLARCLGSGARVPERYAAAARGSRGEGQPMFPPAAACMRTRIRPDAL